MPNNADAQSGGEIEQYVRKYAPYVPMALFGALGGYLMGESLIFPLQTSLDVVAGALMGAVLLDFMRYLRGSKNVE